jgi:hypothetical protein
VDLLRARGHLQVAWPLKGPFPSGSTVKLVLAGVVAVLVFVAAVDLAGEVVGRTVPAALVLEVVGFTVA